MAVYEAQCSAVGGFGYANYFKLYVELIDGNISGNTSKITYNVYCKSSGSGSINATHLKYFRLNGVDIVNQTVSVNVSSPNAYIAIASGTTGAIQHNSDGNKSVSFSAQIKGTTYGVSASISGTFNLTKLGGDTPNFTRRPSITSKTINSIIFDWGNVNIASDIYYSLNNSTWTHVTSSATKISGLNPETTYTIYVQARNQSDNNIRNTTTISATTYSIAKISNAPNINIGNSHTITWSNPSGATTSLKLCKTDGTQVINYGTVTGTSKSITPTASTIYALTPNSNKITLRYILTTTCNNTSYNNYKDCVFTVTNSNPAFSNFTYQDTNTNIVALTGNNQILVKGYSNVKGTISTSNKAVAKNSATMKSYKMLIGSKNTATNYSNNTDVSLTINSIDSNVIDMYAIDSRGNSTKVSKNATIKNYSNIKIVSVQAIRENNIGQAVTLKFEAQFWNASFGSVTNAITSCIYKYKNTSSSTYVDGKTVLTYTISGNKITGNINIKGDLEAEGFDISNSYNIQLILSDRLSTSTYIITLGSGNPAIAVYKNNVAIGQKYDTNDGSKLQVNGDVSLTNRANRININGHKGILKHWTNDTQISANDGSIYFRPKGDENTTNQVTIENSGTVKAPKFNGQLISTTGGSWWGARDNSTVRNNSFGQSAGNSFNVVATQKTSSGAWSIGNLSGEESLSFSYVTDTNYNNKNNANTRITLPNTAGTIQLKPFTLYDNATGTTGTVTLSETAANFTYLEIFYRNDNNRYTSTKVYASNGKTVSLLSSSLDSNSASNLKYKDITVSGTTISNVYTQTLQFWSGAWHNTDGNNKIFIVRVVGYR